MNTEKANLPEESETSRLVRELNSLVKSIEGGEELALRLRPALDLALSIHADQKARPDGPYVNHIVRVADRVIRLLGVTDADIVTAALLHDALEDQTEKLALLQGGRDDHWTTEAASRYVREKFGSRVLAILKGLTNPDFSSLSGREKDEAYAAHVKHAIRDHATFCIKLADFMDNGLTISAVKDDKRRLHLARKYLPIFDMMIDRLGQADFLRLRSAVHLNLVYQLASGKTEAERILEAEK